MSLALLREEDLPHYTYDDYVHWEGRWELIHGIAYAMVPAPTMKHQSLSLDIASQLKQHLETCNRCKVYQAIDWQIAEDTVVQPDVLVVCGDYTERERLLVPPILIFEILSPSTARKDKILKYQLYQDAGVRYYCLVDPQTHSVEIFELDHKSFRKDESLQQGRMAFDLGPCAIALDFSRIFEKY